MEIPISRELPESKNGVFVYTRGGPSNPDIRGVFSFSFYIQLPWGGHPTEMDIARNVYLQGLYAYASLMDREDSVFRGWKVVIYTDDYTLYHLKRLKVDLVENPNIDFCVVRWPYYQKYIEPELNGQVNADILRVMRIRAFFDFPKVPVFMRDADTLWARNISAYSKMLKLEESELYEWESNFLKGASRHPNTFIFASSIAYKRHWHKNMSREKVGPLGAFAGLQSAMPLVPCLQDTRVWEGIIQYITYHSIRTAIKKNVQFYDKSIHTSYVFTNHSIPEHLGKDEQVLLFVLLPACKDHIFFFELDFMDRRRFTLKGKRMNNTNYALSIFNRGNNANIRKLFENAIRSNFRENFEEYRASVEAQNEILREERDEELTALFSTLENSLEAKMKNSKAQYRQSHPARAEYEPENILGKLFQLAKAKDLDKQLENVYGQLSQTNVLYEKKRREFFESIEYNYGNVKIERELEVLQNIIHKRNKLLREFLDTAFRLQPIGVYKTSIPGIYAKEFGKLLEWYGPPSGGKRKTRKVRRG